MFLGLLIGERSQVPRWRHTIEAHADWLGLVPGFREHALADGRELVIGQITAAGADPIVAEAVFNSQVTLNTGGALIGQGEGNTRFRPWSELVSRPKTNAIGIRVSLATGETNAFVPATTPEQLWVGRDDRGTVIANDMRLLMRWFPWKLDERSCFAMLQFGKIPPPLSMLHAVTRVPNAHTMTIAGDGRCADPIPAPIVTDIETVESGGAWALLKPEEAEKRVGDSLDCVLQQAPGPASLFFSGGVDSSLLAARLKVIGRGDVRLVNFSWGPADGRAKLAGEIAAHLGMSFEQVVYNPVDLGAVLARLARDYSYPFGGRSAIPTNLMLDAATARGHLACAFEGTGADGAFGLGPRRRLWERIYRVPRFLRCCAGSLYRASGYWRRDSLNSRLERWMAVLRRTSQFSLEYAAILAQHSLLGIAHDAPPEVLRAVTRAFDRYTLALGAGMSPEDRFCLLDLVAVCAGEFASKCYDPLRRRGTLAVFPFLEPPALGAALSLPWEFRCPDGAPKGILKTMLARHLPREWVYLSKEGFIPPFNEMLAHESMQELFRGVVLSPDNPVMPYFRPEVVRAMIDQAAAGNGISSGAQRFLWNLTFLSAWLAQLPRDGAGRTFPVNVDSATRHANV